MSDQDAVRGYRSMLLARRFDERCISLQRQGRMATLAPRIGQEAASVGAAMAMDPSRDWFVPQYREVAGQIAYGLPMSRVLLWRMGHPKGFQVPVGLNMLPFQAAIAGQIPHAVGIAWAQKLRQETGVVAVFFGDGATSEGDFHEGANLAGVVKAPVVLFCQNNQWAISTPNNLQTAAEGFAIKAVAYGMPGVRCDGNDLFAVYTVMKRAVERARSGQGPTLIEAITYRLGVHTTADDPTRYVPAEQISEWMPRDPLSRLQRYLENRGALTKPLLEQLEAEIRDEIAAAWHEAQREPAPDARDYFTNVFATPTPRLARYLSQLGKPVQ